MIINCTSLLTQSAPLQLKKLPVSVYEGAPDKYSPNFLNASYVSENKLPTEEAVFSTGNDCLHRLQMPSLVNWDQ